MRHTLKLRCAPFAIAAFAALGTTSGHAQESPSAPVILLPDEIGNAQPAPTIEAAPDQIQSVPPIAVEPLVIPESSPAHETTASSIEAEAPPENDASTASPGPVRASSVAEPGSSMPAGFPLQTGETVPASEAAQGAGESERLRTTDRMMQQPLSAEDGAQAARLDADLSEEALLAGLGILGAIGGIGVFATRRRRKTVRKPADAVAHDRPAELPVTEDREKPAVASVPLIEREPRVGSLDQPTVPTSQSGDTFGGLPNEGAAVALPRKVPDNFEERDALFRRMVAARPDRANPFRSPTARAKRAKLILQSLSRKFETRKPRIDLSQYTSNWPALRGWQPTTA